MSANVLDLTGWSTPRIDSAIIRRQNAARELATRDGNEEEIQRLNRELDQLLDARRTPVPVPGAAAQPEKDTRGWLVVEGVEYLIPEKFTMGELADIEEVIGNNPDNATIRMKLGIAWITLRRKDPTWTLERVRNLDMDALDEKGADASPPDGTAA